MPASKLNYIVVYRGESQVYGASSKWVAMKSPPPEGRTIEDKIIMFSTFNPDTGELSVHKLSDEEVEEGYEEALRKKAEKEKEKAKKKKEKNNE